MLYEVITAGGVNVFPPGSGPKITFDDLARNDPEVIVVAPCGFAIGRSMEDMVYLRERPGWKSLRAVREGRVYVCDGSQYFSRPGPVITSYSIHYTKLYEPHAVRGLQDAQTGRRAGTGLTPPFLPQEK